MFSGYQSRRNRLHHNISLTQLFAHFRADIRQQSLLNIRDYNSVFSLPTNNISKTRYASRNHFYQQQVKDNSLQTSFEMNDIAWINSNQYWKNTKLFYKYW